ncbi:MAG TPA: cytochrome ubiquinol oxidase subunit I [Clostridiales bacterium]|nr:cytochrome ubiquinol oxidase subunit I [Clostridiales bacterium]
MVDNSYKDNVKRRGIFFTSSNENSFGISLYFKLLFLISALSMTALFSTIWSWKYAAIGVLCSSIILWWLIFRADILDKILLHNMNKPQMLISVALTFVSMQQFIKALYDSKKITDVFLFRQVPLEYHQMINKGTAIAIGCAAIPAIIVLMYCLVQRVYIILADFITTMDRVEKYYLVIAGALMAVAVFIIFGLTNVFYVPFNGREIAPYDVIYTTDSTPIVMTNSYINIGSINNDSKQPLFGIFALPFGAAAMLVSKITFFIPNAYTLIINIMQVIILFSINIMVARMLQAKSSTKAILLAAATALYPTLIFSLAMEQYIFSTFWLVLMLYSYLSHKEDLEFYYVAAAGSLVTSYAAIPVLYQKKPWKEWFRDNLRVGAPLLAGIIIAGRMPLYYDLVTEFRVYMQFAGGKLLFKDRLLQFINFIATCFVRPEGGIDTKNFAAISYQMDTVTKLNYLGVVMLGLVVLGFALNYKNRFARICFYWIIFSFIILCLVGWGTAENGLILYSLYFYWAFYALVFLFFEKLLSKYFVLKHVVYAALIILLLAVNLKEIYGIIGFGIEYYPAG